MHLGAQQCVFCRSGLACAAGEGIGRPTLTHLRGGARDDAGDERVVAEDAGHARVDGRAARAREISRHPAGLLLPLPLPLLRTAAEVCCAPRAVRRAAAARRFLCALSVPRVTKLVWR